jgi:peptidoglycan hydrolase-like protein with peptidoglycan-binding domain
MSDRFSILVAIYLTCLGLALGVNPKSSLALVPPLTIAQAQSNPPANDSPALNPGSQGKEVRVLQHFLKELGYFEAPLDGEYGSATQTAVSKFQESQKLEVNGVADAQTWERIKAAYNEKQKSEGGKGDSEKTEKPAKGKPRFSRERIILLLGGLVTLGIGGIGMFVLLRAFSKAMPAAISDLSDDVGEEVLEEPDLGETAISKNREADLEFLERDRLKLSPDATAESAQPEVQPIPSQAKAKSEKRTTKREPKKNKSKEPAKTKQSNNKSLAVKQPLRLPKLDLVEELIKDLQEPSPETRRKAIWELAQRSDSRAVQPLIGLLIDSDSQQRGLILEALAQIGTRTLKPMNRALTIALQDENAQVRKNAIRDLTQMYEIIAKLSKLLYLAADDPDPEVQETARWALNQLNSLQLSNVSEESENHQNSS